MLKPFIAVAAIAAFAAPALADPDKDESGHGYEGRYDDRRDYDRDRYDRRDRDRDDEFDRFGRYDRDDRFDRHLTSDGIPAGHLPPPGECRVWYYDRPPGHQPPPTSCAIAEEDAYLHGGRVIYGGRGR